MATTILTRPTSRKEVFVLNNSSKLYHMSDFVGAYKSVSRRNQLKINIELDTVNRCCVFFSTYANESYYPKGRSACFIFYRNSSASSPTIVPLKTTDINVSLASGDNISISLPGSNTSTSTIYTCMTACFFYKQGNNSITVNGM